MKNIVPDTGVLIDGRISELAATGQEKTRVIVSRSTLAELEYQANSGREVGFAGLDELKKLQRLHSQGIIELSFEGERPSGDEIRRARFGEIDSKIRGLAKELKATLMTTDVVMREVAMAEGIHVDYLAPIVEAATLSFEKYFSNKNTLSVHLKECCVPKAKVGLPGEFELREVATAPISRSDLDRMIKEAVEFCKREERSFIEIDKKGATVLQIQDYRVTYTKPPFSESAEMTVVRPITKLKLSDYAIAPKLSERLASHAEGILVAGPPGSGKSTFVTALAEYYASSKKIVKTLESPRDLQVSKDITQYAPLEGSFAQAADVLLLVRPDYTIFDEVRRLDDFKTFTDLRMAGIGMVGVVHASKAIDAVQRFIGKIELGVIPQVIDTIIFIAKGRVAKVYDLAFVIKTPHGMREADLARPVIQVKDFMTAAVEFEIYKWGEETVVFPVLGSKEERVGREDSGSRFGDKGNRGNFGRQKWGRRR
ncbi:MAG: ATPase, T2SS/T4P/T4SS family [Candidatus Micrarchaeota archaeon]